MFHVEHIFPLLCCPVGFLLTGQSWADGIPPNSFFPAPSAAEVSDAATIPFAAEQTAAADEDSPHPAPSATSVDPKSSPIFEATPDAATDPLSEVRSDSTSSQLSKESTGAAVPQTASHAHPAQESGAPEDASEGAPKDEPKDEPLLVLPIASSSEELKQQLTVGWQDLLMGWEESARRHFEEALQHDDRCALAHVGLLLASPEQAQEHISTLQQICGQDSDTLLTPAESFYLSVFLRASGRHIEGAAREMNEHADRYRADLFAALWGIQFLHCADTGYTQEGEVRPLQAEALRRAQALYQKHPSHPLVCYLRAYLEEAAPDISPEALEAAQKASELMPRHPMPQLLLGHLLYRSQREGEALAHFQQAASLAREESRLHSEIADEDKGKSSKAKNGEEQKPSALFLTATLYEATTLWSIGQDQKSLQLRRRLRAIPLPTDSKESASPAATLLRWEARTLPLRVLILRKRVPTQGEIEAAFQGATPEHPSDIDFVLEERNCLRAALSARKKAGEGDMKEAVRSLQLAEEALVRFDKTLARVREVSPHWVTPWHRAKEACLVALCTAKAEVYPSSADIWKENARQAVQPPVLLLPPPVPMRSTTVTAAPSSAPSSARSASRSTIKRPKASSRQKSSTRRASGKQKPKKNQRPSRSRKKKR